MYNIDKIRADFPILKTEQNGKQIVYLDSAATSQKPQQVIDTLCDFYTSKNSNVARGLYKLAENATLEFESVREKTANFVNAGATEEIIFTNNTTEGANLIMRGWGEKFVKKGDKIVTTVMEHHSNFVPWQQLAKRKGATLEVVDITDDGMLDITNLEKKIKGAKMIAVSAASNVLGTINDIRSISKLAHESGAVCVVDGAQSVPSIKTDVRKLDCDFLLFSGHKMLAPFGSGVIYGKPELLEAMDPFLYGSEMIRSVKLKESEWANPPYKFETGTPNVGSILGLGTAIDYINKIGLENIRKHENNLISYMLKRLKEIKGLNIVGPTHAEKRGSLVAFTLDVAHPHDVSAMLADDGICVRSGHHCAMPLHDRLNLVASTRASVYLYNKKEEIDALVQSLEKVRQVFG
ncbi:cysteine desulfurase [Candidatus Micrarchaeota archaeon]|nr:cysteine desulfurase [Candidatus Micrarchaeota archaeon]MBU1166684.1 cysteine desulfurase [Candidatus Micrarchaeota archaeon]MBU1886109.1 cysteine desulfurase [Candidatus Micrarchaeota archaeon]